MEYTAVIKSFSKRHHEALNTIRKCNQPVKLKWKAILEFTVKIVGFLIVFSKHAFSIMPQNNDAVNARAVFGWLNRW